MAFDDALDTINSRGGDWVNLKEIGDKISVVLAHAESRPKTFEGKVVNSQKTGKPRIEVVVSGDGTFTTGGSTSDAKAIKCALDEGAQSAVKKAMALGNAPFAPGSKLELWVTSKVPISEGSTRMFKNYEASLEPAAFSAIQAETPASDLV